jgi:hypothetical protein
MRGKRASLENIVAILAAKTGGLTVAGGFDNLRMLTSLRLYPLTGCKAFFG